MKWRAWWGPGDRRHVTAAEGMVTKTVGGMSISEHSLALTIIREQKAETTDLRRRLDTWMRIAEGATRDRRVAEEYNRRMGARILELEDEAKAQTARAASREAVFRNLEAAYDDAIKEANRRQLRLDDLGEKLKRRRRTR